MHIGKNRRTKRALDAGDSPAKSDKPTPNPSTNSQIEQPPTLRQ